MNNILTYAKLYKKWKTTEDVDESLLVAMRDELTQQGEYLRIVAIEKTVDYETTTDERLKDFINCTKTLLIKTDYANIKAWEKYKLEDFDRSNLSRWTAAIISIFVYDYLKEVV